MTRITARAETERDVAQSGLAGAALRRNTVERLIGLGSRSLHASRSVSAHTPIPNRSIA